MLDYKGIEALFAVQNLQSFEGAAKKLHITQSAISQRIKALESYYGEPVLIRTLPYRLTNLGKLLIGHYRQISLLEENFRQQHSLAIEAPRFSLALNRDSLETWFLHLIGKVPIFQDIILEIIADDQELTLDYLKNGLVSACLSTTEKEISGGRVQFIGNMEYFLVASPSFKRRYFSNKDIKDSLYHAPAIKFDKNDQLHERYLEKYYAFNATQINYQIIPSVRGFKQFAMLGYGYGLIPKIDIINELDRGELIKLSEYAWNIPLYWHYWTVHSKFYQQINSEIIRYAIEELIIKPNMY